MAAPSIPSQTSTTTTTTIALTTSASVASIVCEGTTASVTTSLSSSSSPTSSASARAPTLTYRGSQESPAYIRAKQYLHDGEFETALSVIEEAIRTIQSQLELAWDDASSLDPAATAHRATTESDGDRRHAWVAHHPAIAPFHYLYGTTLLYSIEEAKEDDALCTLPPNENHEQEEEDDDPTGKVSANGAPSDHDDDNEDDQEDHGDALDSEPAAADDLQIAWENLEAARTILQQLLEATSRRQVDDDHHDNNHDHDQNLYRLDLAQVALRQADLQRLNGQYAPAITDYRTCLHLRQLALASSSCYSRLLADVHYHLGLNFLLQLATAETDAAAAIAPEGTNPESGQVPVAAVAAASATSSEEEDGSMNPPLLSPEEKTQLRLRGFFHYLACARVLSGMLLRLSGTAGDGRDQAITELLKTVEDADLPSFSHDGDAPNHIRVLAGRKTTGLDDDDQISDVIMYRDLDPPSMVSHKLSNLRKYVATIVVPTTQTSTFSECRELLDEIQETIDEEKFCTQAVSELQGMKAQISAAAADTANDEWSSETNGQSETPGVRPIQFGSSAAVAVTATAQPIMAVRKKEKKRSAEEAELLTSDRSPAKVA